MNPEKATHQHYPFTYAPSFNMASPQRLDSPYGFAVNTDNPAFTYFHASDYDVRTALQENSDQVVEIAGPTTDGYGFLAAVPLRTRPEITNIDTISGGLKYGSQEQRQLARQHISREVDITQPIPYRDQSIGILAVSCLDRTDSRRWQPIVPSSIPPAEREGAFTDAIVENAQLYMDDPSDHRRTPRIGFWEEAQRTVTPEGVVLVRGIAPEDYYLASRLGFSLVAHSQYSKGSPAHTLPPYECAFSPREDVGVQQYDVAQFYAHATERLSWRSRMRRLLGWRAL